MNTKKAVCGLLFHKNKILSVSRKENHNDFNLFGGKLESGETWKEALIRECYEETGYNINIIPVYYEAMCDDTGEFIKFEKVPSLEETYPVPSYEEQKEAILAFMEGREKQEGGDAKSGGDAGSQKGIDAEAASDLDD